MKFFRSVSTLVVLGSLQNEKFTNEEQSDDEIQEVNINYKKYIDETTLLINEDRDTSVNYKINSVAFLENTLSHIPETTLLSKYFKKLFRGPLRLFRNFLLDSVLNIIVFIANITSFLIKPFTQNEGNNGFTCIKAAEVFKNVVKFFLDKEDTIAIPRCAIEVMLPCFTGNGDYPPSCNQYMDWNDEVLELFTGPENTLGRTTDNIATETENLGLVATSFIVLDWTFKDKLLSHGGDNFNGNCDYGYEAQQSFGLVCRNAEDFHCEFESSLTHYTDLIGGNTTTAHEFNLGREALWITEENNYWGYTNLIIRGADSLADWEKFAKDKLVPLDLLFTFDISKLSNTYTDNDGALIHRGFLEAFLQIKKWLDTKLNNLHTDKLLIIGESFGGAVSTLVALYVKSKLPNLKIHLFTFGSVHVGNIHFNQYFLDEFDNSCQNIIHYRLEDDIVQNLLPELYLPCNRKEKLFRVDTSLIPEYDLYLTHGTEPAYQPALLYDFCTRQLDDPTIQPQQCTLVSGICNTILKKNLE